MRGLALGVLLAAVPALAAAGLEDAVQRAYTDYKGLDEGETAQYIPALANADGAHFGLVAMTVDGSIVEAGDTEIPFAIMSAAKPFTLALLLQQQGREVVLENIGVEPTGLPFNALRGVDRSLGEPLNPMVNAGAITAVSLLEAGSPKQRWTMILDYYGAFAGEPLELMTDVYASVGSSNYRNRALVNLLEANAWLDADPTSTLDIYNKQSCLAVTARQLAAMGATLANGGVHPRTGETVLDPSLVDEVLSVMLLSGFYNESGRWAFEVGLPAKSGVGGGIVAVVPGQLALVAYSPKLSPAGNSVRGMRAIAQIANELNLSIFEAPAATRAQDQSEE